MSILPDNFFVWQNGLICLRGVLVVYRCVYIIMCMFCLIAYFLYDIVHCMGDRGLSVFTGMYLRLVHCNIWFILMILCARLECNLL